MPFLLSIPVLGTLAAFGIGLFTGSSTQTVLSNPAPKPKAGGIDLTTIAGYAIVGGLVYYFGKKIIK